MTTKPLRAETLSKANVKQHILAAIRRSLEQDIVKQIQSEDGVSTVHLIIRLLDFIGEDMISAPASLAGRSGLPSELVEELHALVELAPKDHLEATDLTAIGEALARVLARTDRASLQQPEARFVRRLAAHEHASLSTLDRYGLGVSETYAKGRVALSDEALEADESQSLTADALTSVLENSKLFGPDVRAEDVCEIPGGFNKRTASFVAVHGGKREALIIRRDAAPNPTGFTVVNEYPVLRAVWQAGSVPMAEPLLLVSDPSVLGAPFLIVRRMPGSTDTSHWSADPEAGRRLAQDLARALARLHSIDVRAFLRECEPVKTVGEYISEEIERWHQRSLRWRIRPCPAIDAGYAWMRANIPHSNRKPVLVHGDVGFHNMLMDGGRLTALLDWEFSHIGDPMEDLNYCRPFVSAVCDWPMFIAAYVEAGGVAFDTESEPFFELWPSLRNSSGCDALMRTFLEHPGSDLKYAVAGVQHVRRYEDAILQFLARTPR